MAHHFLPIRIVLLINLYQLMREGNVSVSERQTINNLSDKFEQLRQVIDQAIVSVYLLNLLIFLHSPSTTSNHHNGCSEYFEA